MCNFTVTPARNNVYSVRQTKVLWPTQAYIIGHIHGVVLCHRKLKQEQRPELSHVRGRRTDLVSRFRTQRRRFRLVCGKCSETQRTRSVRCQNLTQLSDQNI